MLSESLAKFHWKHLGGYVKGQKPHFENFMTMQMLMETYMEYLIWNRITFLDTITYHRKWKLLVKLESESIDCQSYFNYSLWNGPFITWLQRVQGHRKLIVFLSKVCVQELS